VREIATQLISWYLVVQLCGLAALPLTLKLFNNLPDRGYAFAKSLGIFLTGLLFWLGYSYSLLRNETGGAWLALLLTAGISVLIGSSLLRLGGLNQNGGNEDANPPTYRLGWGYVVSVEALFLLAFLVWAAVRAYDPAANHTEQPMDLMFMNGIWNSATYPPQDPWLAGYAISYYYFGYWLLNMLARLSGLTPAVAYNVGQACWYGLLLMGCYGVTANLLAIRAAEKRLAVERISVDGMSNPAQRMPGTAMLGGLIGAIAVGVVGNLQSIFEYLVATGRNVSGLVEWFGVYNFAENAQVTDNWYIDFGWWWWRSSRVIRDVDLNGSHLEVIDEFPMFSYILGDNHPHVLAMPFVLLVIALAFNMLLHRSTARAGFVQSVTSMMPLNLVGLVLVVAATGGLYFFNSWDFPPYWLLMMLAALATLVLRQSKQYMDLCTAAEALPSNGPATEDDAADAPPDTLADPSLSGDGGEQGVADPVVERATYDVNVWVGALAFGGLIFIGMLLLYLPYFMTAQSQAGGLVPNAFNPTKFRQFFLMFGIFLPSIVGLILLGWRECAPSWPRLTVSALLTLGLPTIFLVVASAVGVRVPTGERFLGILVSTDRTPLFENGDLIPERWLAAPWTFLIVGLLLATVVALLWQRLVDTQKGRLLPESSLLFVLLLAAVGLLLAFAPEFVYLRDNFGTRMNTVFKFYYQAWLLFGLCTAYVMIVAFRSCGGLNVPVAALASISLVLMIGSLFFPVAGVYSKTAGFSTATEALTLDATAHVTLFRPAERAAIEWVKQNSGPTAVVLEGKGASYRAEYSMMSTLSGRPTLLGWDGHEAQWRGTEYGAMSAGRLDVLETVYRSGSPSEIADALLRWGVEYVYVGPTERTQYEISSRREETLAQAMELVFESNGVQIYALKK